MLKVYLKFPQEPTTKMVPYLQTSQYVRNLEEIGRSVAAYRCPPPCFKDVNVKEQP